MTRDRPATRPPLVEVAWLGPFRFQEDNTQAATWSSILGVSNEQLVFETKGRRLKIWQ